MKRDTGFALCYFLENEQYLSLLYIDDFYCIGEAIR